jgi:hypothetical protein
LLSAAAAFGSSLNYREISGFLGSKWLLLLVLLLQLKCEKPISYMKLFIENQLCQLAANSFMQT